MPDGEDGTSGVPQASPKLVGRTAIFAYDLSILVLLLVVGALYIRFSQFITFGAKPDKLAIEAMWFGSLGGIIISLKGVYDHSDEGGDWDPEFNLWHIGRPFSGGVAGLVTLLLLYVINGDKEPAPVLLYAAAFIFGTQERRFFNFLSAVARLIVQVPEDANAPGLRITEIQPRKGSPGDVIVIAGQGIAPHTTIRLGTAKIDKLVVSTTGSYAAGVVPKAPQGEETVDVTAVDETGASYVLRAGFAFIEPGPEPAKTIRPRN